MNEIEINKKSNPFEGPVFVFVVKTALDEQIDYYLRPSNCEYDFKLNDIVIVKVFEKKIYEGFDFGTIIGIELFDNQNLLHANLKKYIFKSLFCSYLDIIYKNYEKISEKILKSVRSEIYQSQSITIKYIKFRPDFGKVNVYYLKENQLMEVNYSLISPIIYQFIIKNFKRKARINFIQINS